MTQIQYIAGTISKFFGIAGLCVMLAGCLGIPDNAVAVDDFELERYLGTWYEIARLDHRFERGLSHVKAEYELREDGGVRVVNSGYDTANKEWSTAEGKAFFVGEPDIGRLKVSFFGPFYGAYNIVELDKTNYRYAMIIGPNTDYLWILARDPSLEPAVMNRLKARAEELGFPVEELIFPEHDTSKLDQQAYNKEMTMPNITSLNMDSNMWNAVHDRVMGGVSDGDIVATDSGLRFQGTLSLDYNGGFASVRRVVTEDLDGVDRVKLRVLGDGRRYQVRLRSDNNRDGVAWREQFDTDGSWQDIEFSLDNFDPVFRGRRLAGYEPLQASSVRQIGLMLADGKPGPYQLDISEIAFLRSQ